MALGIMIRQRFSKSNTMTSKYSVGQKVIISPVHNQHLSSRDYDLEQYAGQTGEITDYYSITLDRGAKVFYIYTVRIGTSHKEVVLHEDELEAYIV